MPEHYLRVEAVNLDDSVYDTDDISTIRGGSFMLLDAVESIAADPSLSHLLESLSIGASTGLFRIRNNAPAQDKDPEQIKAQIHAYLEKRTQGHATFSVDLFDGEGKTFAEIQERLIAMNRWRQMQQLTVSLPEGWFDAEEPCYHDGVRPGLAEERPGPEQKRKISNSVAFRRQQGRALRNRIYTRIIGPDASDVKFTGSLLSLSMAAPAGVPKHLEGKIAFIYIDGNKFSKIRMKHCNEPAALKQFDTAVQDDFRRPVLKRVVQQMQEDSTCWAQEEGEEKLRLETLLWGGDEIEWIVPAWKGWEVLRLFYELDPPPAFDRSSAPEYADEAIPITHGAGIVFCKNSAPILHIRNLARDLAEMAKEKMPRIPQTREEGDIFHYLALDSFDMAEGDTKDFLSHFYKPCSFDGLVMRGREMGEFSKHLKTLRAAFPRGKVYEIAHALKCGEDVAPIVQSGLSFCRAEQRDAAQGAVEALTRDGPHRWFTVVDLWDFA